MIGLSQIAYTHIRTKLLSGSFPSGSMLSETTLAKEIGISRTPVREAIAQLEREGLLDQIPRYGTFVRVMDREEMAELYEFRAQMESFAAIEAAKFRTDAQLKELEDSCKQMFKLLRTIKTTGSVNADIGQKWRLLDAAFHTVVLQAAKNRWFAKAAGDMRLMAQTFGRWQEMPGWDMLSIWVRTWREHRRLIRALRLRDAATASAVIKDHILLGKQKLLKYFDWAEQHRANADTAQVPDTMRDHLKSLQRYLSIADRQLSERAKQPVAQKRRKR